MSYTNDEQKKIRKLPSESFSRKNINNNINYSTDPNDYLDDNSDEEDFEEYMQETKHRY